MKTDSGDREFKLKNSISNDKITHLEFLFTWFKHLYSAFLACICLRTTIKFKYFSVLSNFNHFLNVFETRAFQIQHA